MMPTDRPARPSWISPAAESLGMWLEVFRAEWDAPDHGLYGPVLARLPAVRHEAAELVAEITAAHPWGIYPPARLVGWVELYTKMLPLPWRLFGPVIEGGTPAEAGAAARALCIFRVWWTQRTTEDPFALVFLVYVLASAGPAAASELERRLDTSKSRDLARLAPGARHIGRRPRGPPRARGGRHGPPARPGPFSVTFSVSPSCSVWPPETFHLDKHNIFVIVCS